MLGTDRFARSFEAQLREVDSIREVGWSEFRHGAQLAVLQTSEAGFPVYRRLGFEHTESWAMWTSDG